jgi:hypothetical protein
MDSRRAKSANVFSRGVDSRPQHEADAVDETAKSLRAPGSILILSAIVTFALILLHPETHATDFLGVLREEAATQSMDAVVHGSFIAVLAIQLACYALLSERLGRGRFFPTAAFTFFAVGTGALMASLLTDGLIIPALAAKYVVAGSASLPYARSLFVLCGTAIKFLMPIGLGFQGAGIAAWGATLFKVAHGTGLAALLLGIAMLACVTGGLFGSPVLVMAAVAGIAIWALLAGIWMFRQRT